MLPYVFFGIISGLVTFSVSLFSGNSIWWSFLLYCLSSTIITVLLPLVEIAVAAVAEIYRSSANSDIFIKRNSSKYVEAGPIPAVANQRQFEAKMRILAVDDDPSIQELIKIIAAQAGYTEIVPVASGELALAALKSSKKTFDCLLFDINMPAMDGVELCQRTRELPAYSKTPIIMLTAMREMKNMEQAFKAGATDYVTKPFDVAEMGTRLRLAQSFVAAQENLRKYGT